MLKLNSEVLAQQSLFEIEHNLEVVDTIIDSAIMSKDSYKLFCRNPDVVMLVRMVRYLRNMSGSEICQFMTELFKLLNKTLAEVEEEQKAQNG